MTWLWAICGTLLLVSTGWAQGYRLEKDRLVVDRGHWREWNFPTDAVQFNAEGARPRFIRAQVDAALDAGTFRYGDGVRGGIRNAGTNLALAASIIDGREDTFWEPAPDAPLDRWWVEVDLGRAVWAEKIVVKFAEEGAGDPFLQFKVLTSNGRPAFQQSKEVAYVFAGRSEGLNKTQRVFEFDLKPTLEADPGLSGDLVQFFQVVATASDGGQAEEISESLWNSLPEEERGDVLYFRRTVSGGMRRVERSEYEAFTNPEKRGPIKYYRRERPRLAEVEVWTAGDNISLGALNRGGKITGYGNLGTEGLTVDGDYNTSTAVQVAVGGSSDSDDNQVVEDVDRDIFFDLGAWYWVNRALLIFDRIGGSSDQEGALANYVINLSDGRRAPDGSLSYLPLTSRGIKSLEEGENNRRLAFQDNVFPLTKARYLRLYYRLLILRWINGGIREIQLYGRGFLPQVSLTSGLIELGQNSRILSTITWEAETPPGTQVQIRTRTGDQLNQEIHYFTKTGLEVSAEKYHKLLSFQRGDSLTAVIPGEDWSHWSQFYQTPGELITSPSPRRYAMIQATLLSDDPDQAALLHNLSIHLDNPLASQLLGEIAPQRIQQNGQVDTLTLFLRPIFQAGNRGFDQVLVEFPPGAEVELVDVAVGPESDLAGGKGRVYARDDLEWRGNGSDSLWVRLPERVQKGQELVALHFASVLYLGRNAFVTSVGLGEGEGQIWQRVDEGDATSLGEGREMTVAAPFAGGLLSEVEVSPNPFTPNGDGINDVVEFTFQVFRVQVQKSLALEVYGLDGRLVQRLEKPVAHAAGRQQLVWDGRDDDRRLLPPGLYICRIGLDVDAENVEQPSAAKLVSLVY